MQSARKFWYNTIQMTDSIQVAAYTGGELRLLSEENDASEAVLALPLSRLIVRMVRVPEEGREDPAAFATPLLQAMSPYPDEPLKVSCETVREDGNGLIVLAAALPESATDDIAEALDAKKLNVTRVDALVLGELRKLWSGINTSDGARRLIKVKSPDCTTLIVLDGDAPSSVRAVSEGASMKREEMLSLLEAEDFGGPKELEETLEFERDVVQAMEGVAERSLEEGALNALPESWGEVLAETRFKAKLCRRLGIAGGVWAFIMAVLFGVPVVFGFLTDHQKSLCKEHSRQYQEVRQIKEKVELVQKYSDHSRGALEIMKAVSDRLPQGIDLDSWSFRRGESLKITGLADEDTQVYKFKDQLVAAAAAEDDSDRVFKTVELGSLSSKGGRQRFPIDLGFVEEVEE